MANAAVPADLLQSVVAYFNPRQVILFGSHARGEAGPNSDIDLVVVLDDDAPRENFSDTAVQEARKDYRRSCDIAVWRKSDFHHRAGIIGSLPYTVLREGRVIYGEDLEPNVVTRMNVGPTDPAAQRAEARRWIAMPVRTIRGDEEDAGRRSGPARRRDLPSGGAAGNGNGCLSLSADRREATQGVACRRRPTDPQDARAR